jgi:hypothetical protein
MDKCNMTLLAITIASQDSFAVLHALWLTALKKCNMALLAIIIASQGCFMTSSVCGFTCEISREPQVLYLSESCDEHSSLRFKGYMSSLGIITWFSYAMPSQMN